MFSFKSLVFLAVITSTTQNTTFADTSLRVGNLGRNATSPLQYGIMFEVWKNRDLTRIALILHLGYQPFR